MSSFWFENANCSYRLSLKGLCLRLYALNIMKIVLIVVLSLCLCACVCMCGIKFISTISSSSFLCCVMLSLLLEKVLGLAEVAIFALEFFFLSHLGSFLEGKVIELLLNRR